jgi:hypothetical protein
MYLLYLDDSGSVGNASDRHIVLAGLAVYERAPPALSRALDVIAQRLWPDDPAGLEFRGADILGGRKRWRGIAKNVREDAFVDALSILGRSRDVRIFAAAIEQASVSPDDPMERAFEEICNRFDRFLGRLHKAKDTQRGMIVLDRSAYETSLQRLSLDFRTIGHRWGQIYNLADVPLFVDSRATRMIQFADLVAYAIRKGYENDETRYFDILAPRFDASGGAIHGLVHLTAVGSTCACASCLQRRDGARIRTLRLPGRAAADLPPAIRPRPRG